MSRSNRLHSEKQIISVTSWKEADKFIKEIGELQNKVKELEDFAEGEIAAIKTKLTKNAEPFQKQLKLNIESLEVFALHNKPDFEGQKSKKLNFGILGWRKSTIVKIGRNTLQLIKDLFTPSQQKQLIRVKEYINKEDVGKLTEEELSDIEAQRKDKEVFFVEPNKVEAVDYKN